MKTILQSVELPDKTEFGLQPSFYKTKSTSAGSNINEK